MKFLSYDEINRVAINFLHLRTQENSAVAQNQCVKELEFLIVNRIRKYQKFENYSDLYQEGFEGLLLAMKTYDPARGNFGWWANKYITTRIWRSANSHSTIKYPVKFAKEFTPHKVWGLPIMTDESETPEETLEVTQQKQRIQAAVEQLSGVKKQIVTRLYGLNGIHQQSLDTIGKALRLNKDKIQYLLGRAEIQLKKILEKSGK